MGLRRAAAAALALASGPAVAAAQLACASGAAGWNVSQSLHAAKELAIQARIEGEDVVLELSAQHDGWLGFGIAEDTSGSMIGADIVTAGFGAGAAPFVTDRFVPWSAFPFAPYGGSLRYYAKDVNISTDPSLWPVEDEQQDWTLDDSAQAEGCIRFVVRRKLDTGDQLDRPFSFDEPIRIIWAYGDGDEVDYHGSQRGATKLDSGAMELGGVPCADGVCQERVLSMGNYTILPQETSYVCRSFTVNDVEGHVVEIHPDIDTSYAHHMILHVCDDSDYVAEHETAKLCGGASTGKGKSPLGATCSSMIFGWAVGGGGVVLPAEAGFPFGPGKIEHLVIEIHYDNPSEDQDQVDNTSLRLVYAPTPRKYEAGVILHGDGSVRHQRLAPGVAMHQRVSHCPGECTQAAFDEDIHVFGSLLHMHSFGKRIWSERYTSLESPPDEINYIENWNFAFQEVTPVNFTVSPGDSLFVYCEYDTSKWQHDVTFGVDSIEEMCMEFLFYYPAQYHADRPFAFCGGILSPFEFLLAEDRDSYDTLVDAFADQPLYQSLNSANVCGNFENLEPQITQVESITHEGQTYYFTVQQTSPRWNQSRYVKEFKVGPEAEGSAPTPPPTAMPDTNGTDSMEHTITPLGGGHQVGYTVVSEGDDCYLSLEVSVPGHRWLAFGLGSSMVTSQVVIGTDDDSFAAAPVAEYTITSKSKSAIKPGSGGGLVEAGTYEFADGVSTMRAKLTSINGESLRLHCEEGASTTALTSVVVAFGKDGGSFAQHDGSARAVTEVAFAAPTASPTALPTISAAPTASPTPLPTISAAPTASPTPLPTISAAPARLSALALAAALVVVLAVR